MNRSAEPSQGEIENLTALFSANRLAESEAEALRLVQTWPMHGFGWKALGTILLVKMRFTEALRALEKARELLPLDPEAHMNMAGALHALGRLPEAEMSYRKAIDLKPDSKEAHNNLGLILREMGRLPEAEASYLRALELDPEFHSAHINLGVLFKHLGRQSEAEASYRRALHFKPDSAEAYNNLGNLLAEGGRLADAAESYRRALDIEPGWLHGRSNLLFFLAYFGVGTSAQYLSRAKHWEVDTVPPQARATAKVKSFSYLDRKGRRLRIGYLSGDLRAHPVGYFMEPILEFHDRARFEVFAYPTNGVRDAVTERISRNVDHWHVLAGVSDSDAVDLIARHQVDVLVDLSGHTADNRLGIIARRAAPVQCHYLGYFASTGLTEMDYLIGDSNMIPEVIDDQYSEKIWRLPRAWISYAASTVAPVPVWHSPPDGKVCLGSFNHLGKITARTVNLWARVLQRIPDASLLIKTKELHDSANRHRILREFERHGVPESRIELLGRTEDWANHMALYNRVDVALDPVGGSGGATTTCDALWMGTPVVTLAGERHVERMSSSILSTIGHEDWVTSDEDDYVETVSRLAENRALRKQLRISQRETMGASALCDASGLARALEGAFESMINRWSDEQT